MLITWSLNGRFIVSKFQSTGTNITEHTASGETINEYSFFEKPSIDFRMRKLACYNDEKINHDENHDKNELLCQIIDTLKAFLK